MAFNLKSGNKTSFKKMGSSPMRHPRTEIEPGVFKNLPHPDHHVDYEEHYGTYAEYKADSDAAGVEPLDIETWKDLNAANMPSGKDTKKGYNSKRMVWKGNRSIEREKIDPEYAEEMRKWREEGPPDDFIEYLDRQGGVDTEVLTDE